MTREEAIHFAECLKHNYTINFADMEVFCDMAIKALGYTGPCDLCRYNPPGSGDGKPCSMCPACSGGSEE